jgi:hypothetical protein
LTIFEKTPEAAQIVFYGSDHGPVESRVLDTRGRSINLDARRALGENLWGALSNEARRRSSLEFRRESAATQAIEILGPRAASAYERGQLESTTVRPARRGARLWI